MAVSASHLGCSVWGNAHRRRRSKGLQVAGRPGKHQPTQPMTEDVETEM